MADTNLVLRSRMARLAAVAMTLFIASACSHTSPGVEQHDHEVARTAGDHVLNCVTTLGHHVYKVPMTCPLGGEEFEALALGTHSTYGVSLDWESMSYMRFPVPLPVCPSNGFVVVDDEVSGDELGRTAELVESAEYQALYAERHATYFLYAWLTERLGDESVDLWWLYRQATSEANVCGAEDRYQQYALATIEQSNERPRIEQDWSTGRSH